MRKLLLPLFAGVIALSMGLWGCSSSPGPNSGVITASGTIEGEEIEVSSEIAGRVVELPIEEGQKVKKGQLMARLDATVAELQVRQAQAVVAIAEATVKGAQAGVKGAQAKLADTKAGSRSQQIRQAEAAVKQMEALLAGAITGVETAKKNYDKVRFLYTEGSASEQDLINAQAKYDQAMAQQQAAQAQLEGAREQYNLLRDGATSTAIKIQDANLLQAKSGQEQAQRNLEQARATLALAQAQLAKTKIYAPVSGTVVFRNVNPGEVVSPGKSLYTIMAPDQLWIKVYIPETELARIKVGQPAQVTVDGYPGKVFRGQVASIATKAEFTPKNIQTKEDRVKTVFAVKVRVQNEKGILKAGLPADVEISR